MNKPKQVIVMRKDLNMRKGKIAAQAAHASIKVFSNHLIEKERMSNVFGEHAQPEEDIVYSYQLPFAFQKMD